MSQSKGVTNSCQQLVYLSQWFTEMSEMQRQDFLKYLIQKYGKCGQQTDSQFINGFNQLGMSDRPASIFQCRMKLFSEWFAQWSDEEKAELLIRLRNIDSKFMDEFQTSVDTAGANSQSTTGADDDQLIQLNGNISDDNKSTEHLALNGINGQHLDDECAADGKADGADGQDGQPDSPNDVPEAQEDVIDEEQMENLSKGLVELTATDGSMNEPDVQEVQEVCG